MQQPGQPVNPRPIRDEIQVVNHLGRGIGSAFGEAISQGLGEELDRTDNRLHRLEVVVVVLIALALINLAATLAVLAAV